MKNLGNALKPLILLLSMTLVLTGCSSDDDSSSSTHRVTTSVSPEDSGTILPKSGDFESGKLIDLAALPEEGWEFKEWQGDVTGTENPMQITVDGAKNIMAIFKRKAFYLAENGVTIKAPDAAIGDTGKVNGVTYTKRSVDQITVDNAATTCTSGITTMNYLFPEKMTFNADISHWDVSSVTNMNNMFNTAVAFNQDLTAWDVSNVTSMERMFTSAKSFNGDISTWDVSNVTNMEGMFRTATDFNRDLSGWCVTKITSKPTRFDSFDNFSENNHPVWGTCP